MHYEMYHRPCGCSNFSALVSAAINWTKFLDLECKSQITCIYGKSKFRLRVVIQTNLTSLALDCQQSRLTRSDCIRVWRRAAAVNMCCQ